MNQDTTCKACEAGRLNRTKQYRMSRLDLVACYVLGSSGLAVVSAYMLADMIETYGPLEEALLAMGLFFLIMAILMLPIVAKKDVLECDDCGNVVPAS